MGKHGSEFLDAEFVLLLFGSQRHNARWNYRQFLEAGVAPSYAFKDHDGDTLLRGRAIQKARSVMTSCC